MIEYSVKEYIPTLNTPVFIKTNWNSYIARLAKSPFGGVEFQVLASSHTVQLTTVTGWMKV